MGLLDRSDQAFQTGGSAVLAFDTEQQQIYNSPQQFAYDPPGNRR